MLSRLKKALVESYVGAIGLGWILAQGVLHFAFIFSAPVANWLYRREYAGLTPGVVAGFSFRDAIPEAARSIAALVIGYLLLRWLYYKPTPAPVTESSEPKL